MDLQAKHIFIWFCFDTEVKAKSKMAYYDVIYAVLRFYFNVLKQSEKTYYLSTLARESYFKTWLNCESHIKKSYNCKPCDVCFFCEKKKEIIPCDFFLGSAKNSETAQYPGLGCSDANPVRLRANQGIQFPFIRCCTLPMFCKVWVCSTSRLKDEDKNTQTKWKPHRKVTELKSKLSLILG